MDQHLLNMNVNHYKNGLQNAVLYHKFEDRMMNITVIPAKMENI